MFKKVFIFAALTFVLLILGILLFTKDFTVNLTESQMQTAIDEKIKAGPVRSRGIDLTLKSASIDFKANDSAAIDVKFDAAGFGYAGNIAGNFTSSLRYKQPEIFLDNIVPVNIAFTPDTETNDKIKDTQNVATDFLKRERQEMSDEARTSLENIIGRNEEKVKSFATSATYGFFETLPIYDLRQAGFKGSLASLALTDIRFTEDAAIITLSPVLALIKILSFCAIAFVIFWMYIGRFLPKRREVPASQ